MAKGLGWHMVVKVLLLGSYAIVEVAAKIALISMTDSFSGSVRRSIGTVTKVHTPLFEQDRPWEPRIDNGYPNVLKSETGEWQIYYGSCAAGCGVQLLLFANSSDGIQWDKPNLGLYDVGQVRPDLKSVGKNNNILLEGGGIGVYRDPQATDPAKRFVAFGPGCYDLGPAGGCRMMRWAERDGGLSPEYPHKVLAFSSDGLTWGATETIHWPAPQRWDCHNNLFRDAGTQHWVATTRDGFSQAPGRTIGIASSSDGALAFNTSVAPTMTLAGSMEHQLYSQITFPWLNIYLGIVMVFDANDAAESVHCRLAWSTAAASASAWQWVDEGGLTGRDLIPLGAPTAFDSHICFAARPLTDGDEERLYYMGGNGPHGGARNSSLGLARLRRDGFASMSGTGTLVTAALTCTGARLRVTFDVEAGGALQVGIAGDGALAPEKAVPFTSSGTDATVAYADGANYTALVGTPIRLTFVLRGASAYTVGWTDD